MLKFQRLLLLTTFFLQALIPVGFMPSYASDNSFIVICSGITGKAVQIQTSPENGFEHENEDEDVSGPCAYYTIGNYTTPSLPDAPYIETTYISHPLLFGETSVYNTYITSNHSRGPPTAILT